MTLWLSDYFIRSPNIHKKIITWDAIRKWMDWSHKSAKDRWHNKKEKKVFEYPYRSMNHILCLIHLWVFKHLYWIAKYYINRAFTFVLSRIWFMKFHMDLNNFLSRSCHISLINVCRTWGQLISNRK